VISLEQYFAKPHSPAQTTLAADLLERVNTLVAEAVAAGAFEPENDPDTGCEISGELNGNGDGGFRTPGSPTGAPGSPHKQAMGVDVYDPDERLDKWLDGFEDGQGGNSKLAEHGLYREATSATIGWCHLQTRATLSGKRTFQP